MINLLVFFIVNFTSLKSRRLISLLVFYDVNLYFAILTYLYEYLSFFPLQCQWPRHFFGGVGKSPPHPSRLRQKLLLRRLRLRRSEIASTSQDLEEIFQYLLEIPRSLSQTSKSKPKMFGEGAFYLSHRL